MPSLFSRLFPSQPSTSYLVIRKMLVLGLCLFFVAQAVNTWITYSSQTPPEQLSPKDGQQSIHSVSLDEKKKPQIDVQTIIQRNIFGGSPEDLKGGKEKTSAPELDKLPLAEYLKDFRLLGTIVTSDGTSLAIILNTRSKKQELKSVGDRLNGARITDIVRNNVIVNNGEQDAALSIDYKVRARLEESSSQKPTSSVEAKEEQKQKAVTLDRERIQDALSDLDATLEQSSISPYLEDGVSVGIQVDNIQKDSFLRTLQLQDKDILMHTANLELNTPQGILDLIQELQGSDAVMLSIRRDGQDMILQYQLE